MNIRARVLESSWRVRAGLPGPAITGPRRSGKTTLLRHVFPKADYRLLEDPDELARVRNDPRGFVASLRRPAIIDEIQNAPDLFNYLRTLVDAHPRPKDASCSPDRKKRR